MNFYEGPFWNPSFQNNFIATLNTTDICDKILLETGRNRSYGWGLSKIWSGVVFCRRIIEEEVIDPYRLSDGGNMTAKTFF